MSTFDDAADRRSQSPAGPESGSRERGVDDLEARLDAVERALTDGETPVADLEDAEALERRLDAVETAVEDLRDRVAELEAASRALRGYAGSIRAVNEDVERTAELALAKAETIERSLGEDLGLRIERLDLDVADEAADDSITEAPADPHAESAHASDADVSAAVESASGTESTVDIASAVEAASVIGSTDRSLSERIRDAL